MKIDFEKNNGLVPVIVQDYFNKTVLMLGYMSEEAYNITIETEKVTFFSRSRQQLWTKGESSGNFLQFVGMSTDCDKDSLLIQAIPTGPTCHMNTYSCFESEIDNDFSLEALENIIHNKYENQESDSYTVQLLNKGINKVAQKVGEEAVELVIEAKDEDKDLFMNEAADLIYHFLVLLKAKSVSLSEVINLLRLRHKSKG